MLSSQYRRVLIAALVVALALAIQFGYKSLADRNTPRFDAKAPEESRNRMMANMNDFEKKWFVQANWIIGGSGRVAEIYAFDETKNDPATLEVLTNERLDGLTVAQINALAKKQYPSFRQEMLDAEPLLEEIKKKHGAKPSWLPDFQPTPAIE